MSALLVASACSNTSDADAEDTRREGNNPSGSSINGLSAPIDGTGGDWVPSNGYIAVDPGDLFICALRTDHRIVCWGDGDNGQTKAPEGDFKAISTGRNFACGIRLNGTVACWGEGEDKASPPEGEFAAISTGYGRSGYDFSCGINLTHEVVCWGKEIFYPLPAGPYRFVEVGVDDICGIRRDTGQIQCANYSHGVPPDGQFEAISGGPGYTCAIRLDKTVECWGASRFEADSPPEGAFSQLVARLNFACGLRTDGEIVCWGLNDDAPCWDQGPLCKGWGHQPFPAGPFVRIDAIPAIHGHYDSPHYPQPICAVRVDGSFSCRHGAAASPNPPAGSFRLIDSGRHWSCAIDIEDEVTCWGPSTPDWTVPTGQFASVSVGDYHACGLRPSGEAECWGWELYGEAQAPEGRFVAVDAGVLLSCGLRPDGEAECWGYDAWWLHHPPPGPFTAISVGDGSVCGVRAGGELDCWGRRREGPIPDGRFRSFSLNDHACGLRLDEALVCADKPANRYDYTFYEPEYSVFVADVADRAPGGTFASFSGWGKHACGLRLNGTVDCWDAADDWRATSPTGRFTAISAESGQGCGIRPDRTLECWSVWEPPGWGIPDETSRTAPASTTTPTTPEPPEPTNRGIPWGLSWVQAEPRAGQFSAIDSGELHTCALTRVGSAYCWGAGSSTARGGPFTAISTGGRHECVNAWYCSTIACGIRPGGEPHCWEVLENLPPPLPQTLPDAGEPVSSLDIGFGACTAPISGGVACAYRSGRRETETWWWEERSTVPADGEFLRISVGYGWVWPPQSSGPEWVAGDSPAVSRPTSAEVRSGPPPPPPRLGDSPAVTWPTSAEEHACALRTDGELFCWGSNEYGQAEAPPAWLDLGPYRDVAAGMRHTCALGRTGEAICWGDNRRGQTDAPEGSFEQISAGMWHTCGLHPDGEIECWGNGTAGYRDDQYDEPPASAPTQPPDGPFVEVAAGQWHTCARRADGTVACWYSY